MHSCIKFHDVRMGENSVSRKPGISITSDRKCANNFVLYYSPSRTVKNKFLSFEPTPSFYVIITIWTDNQNTLALFPEERNFFNGISFLTIQNLNTVL